MLMVTPGTRGSRGRKGLAALGDPDLLQACLDGSEDAWGEVIERYGRLVYSIPRRYTLSDADADDVFQTVFTILYKQLKQIRNRDRLSAWLIRVTHRECYRIGRGSRRYAQLERSIEDVGTPSDEQAAAWERQHIVRAALRRLGGRCEQLLTALFLATGEPNYEAIAQQLGMKIGSIGPTRARCFEKLEKILVEMGLQPRSE